MSTTEGLTRGVVIVRGSKRDSSTACPGASRKTKGAGHSAQNDDAAGRARDKQWESFEAQGKQAPALHSGYPSARGDWRSQRKAKTPARCRRYKSTAADGDT